VLDFLFSLPGISLPGTNVECPIQHLKFQLHDGKKLTVKLILFYRRERGENRGYFL
jgi:hypothetical protein